MTRSAAAHTSTKELQASPSPGRAAQTVLSFGEALACATAHAMAQDPRVVVYGEGINDPGGFFGSTVGLQERFGESRCFDVPNSEEALMGFGIGAALMGYRPLFVNLRIEFLMLAMNQLMNHAARLPAMAGHAYTIPLTIRAIVGKGWGQAAQHSSAIYTAFANSPGLQVVVPSCVEDAPGLLLGAIASDLPTIFIESKALYELRGAVESPLQPLPLGAAHVVRQGSDVTFVAISDMVGCAQRIAERLAPRGITAEVLDLRTLAPLDAQTMLASIAKTKRVVVFDIGWEPFGLAAEVARILCMSGTALAQPMLSVARKFEHTPASCFLEYQHYPVESEIAARLARQLKEGR